MRTITGSILIITAMLAASPAHAQAYDPSHPICLQVYGISGRAISCDFASMAQCEASASGRAAQCIVNPFYAGAPQRGGAYRRM